MQNKNTYLENAFSETTYRTLKKNDFKDICNLMVQIKPPIVDLHSPKIYSAICRDALKDKRLVFVVAEKYQNLIGFTIAIIDRKKFWRSFSFRHPLLATRIFMVKGFRVLRSKITKSRPVENKIEKEHLTLINKWIKSSQSIIFRKYAASQIAHTQYTAVTEGHRKEGIGVELQNSRDRILAELGVKQLRSNVYIENISGIIMNYRRGGWKAERKGKWIAMSRDI